jgi:hypothetical protein
VMMHPRPCLPIWSLFSRTSASVFKPGCYLACVSHDPDPKSYCRAL